ncbi:MAG: hypothetical protein RLZZ502_1087 [Pseudomonadota bacterium]|jgi:hypothetical protein
MSLLDGILNQVLQSGQVQDHHYDEVLNHAPQELMGSGLGEAFRSDQTPPMGEMVSALFGQSNGQQQAGLLNQILSTLGPAAAAALAGGALGKIMSPGATQVTPAQAAAIDPEQVRQVVTQAQAAEPGLADQLGNFYANHSGLVKTLGGAAMLIALSKMKDGLANRA